MNKKTLLWINIALIICVLVIGYYTIIQNAIIDELIVKVNELEEDQDGLRSQLSITNTDLGGVEKDLSGLCGDLSRMFDLDYPICY